MKKPASSPVDKVIEHFGSPSKAAEALGIPAANIGMWKHRKRVPPERVLQVERLTGISRHELRPDIFGESGAAA